MTAQKIYTAYDLLKTEGILKTNPEEKLSKVLAQLRNSHDAVFVFGPKNEFIGVVSYVDVFRKGSINENSKVKNIVKMPPKLSLSSRLPEIAKKMLDSRIYFLPVIDNNGKFEGIVSVNRLINFIIKNELLSGNKDRILFSPRNIITVTENEEIDTVLALMHKENNSKAVILDENNKVKGIVSRYDLKEVKLKDIRNSRGGRIGERKPESKEPIKNYMKSLIVTLQKIPNFSQAYQTIIRNKVRTIILVDRENYPIGIVTYTDLLNTIAENEI